MPKSKSKQTKITSKYGKHYTDKDHDAIIAMRVKNGMSWDEIAANRFDNRVQGRIIKKHMQSAVSEGKVAVTKNTAMLLNLRLANIFTTTPERMRIRELLLGYEHGNDFAIACADEFDLRFTDDRIKTRLKAWFQHREKMVAALDRVIARTGKPADTPAPAPAPTPGERLAYTPPTLEKFDVALEEVKILTEIRDSVKRIEALMVKMVPVPSLGEIITLEPAGGTPGA